MGTPVGKTPHTGTTVGMGGTQETSKFQQLKNCANRVAKAVVSSLKLAGSLAKAAVLGSTSSAAVKKAGTDEPSHITEKATSLAEVQKSAVQSVTKGYDKPDNKPDNKPVDELDKIFLEMGRDTDREIAEDEKVKDWI